MPTASTSAPLPRPIWDAVAIVGVGLIGGSIGLALRERELARSVVGIGRRETSLREARRYGAVTTTSLDLMRGVQGADVVVVCTPVAMIASQLVEAAAHVPASALLTDAGSTKAAIVRDVERSVPKGARFVGSHPMAGGEKNGVAEARADLFEGRVVVVTPSRRTAPETTQAAGDFWAALGAQVMMMSPQAHDRAVAGASHLPHLVASLLAAVTRVEDAPLVATGWQDTTRIAAGDPELWRQILLANDRYVLDALARLEKQIGAARRALERGDGDAMKRLLTKGKAVRDALGD